jgi:hypothetical protein
MGQANFQDGVAQTTTDDTDFDSGDWGSETVSGLKWTITDKVLRKVVAAAPTTYDPAQEIVRLASVQLGTLNVVEIRWYEMMTAGPRVEAYQGYASAAWSPDGGGATDPDTVTITFNGRGAKTAITHPDGAAAVPMLYSVSPAVGVQAGGTLHYLYGQGFTLAGVDNVASMLLGVTNVPTFRTLNDNVLAFLAPAKAAGPFIIYVTNGVGKSVTTAVILTIT